MSWRPPTRPMRSCSRIWRGRSSEWERSLNTSTPVAWAPARGLVAHYSFDGDLAPQVAVLQDAKSPRPQQATRHRARAS